MILFFSNDIFSSCSLNSGLALDLGIVLTSTSCFIPCDFNISRNLLISRVEYPSVWNKEKKRAQLITDKYIGKITPDGIIVPKYERVIEQFKHVTAKEYGASRFIHLIGEDLLNDLKKTFSNGELIFTMAAIRFLHSSPLKNMQIIYDTSYFSDVFEINLSPRILGDMLRST